MTRANGISETGARPDPGGFARRLLRGCDRATLASSLRGAPYASLVLVAADLDASPLLLLSDLAQHSRNIGFDPRVALLFDGTEGHPDPLAGPRLSVLGLAEAVDDPHLLARFTARHPSALRYAGFADFRLYRVRVERGHLVAGFGRIEWIAAGELLFMPDTRALAAAGPAILAQINEEQAAAIEFYAQRSARTRRQRLADHRHRPGRGRSALRRRDRPARFRRSSADPRGGARRPRRPRRGGARIASALREL